MNEYMIEIDYVSTCSTKVTYHPGFFTNKYFEHEGNPIEACNCRIRQILESKERDITQSNLLEARLFDSKKNLLLKVDYRKEKMNLTISVDIENFWVKL